MLREYQRRTLDQLYGWFRKNSGNPCIVMPTGSGKSHIVAALCKEAVQEYPETRILMLTHVKELIEQNAEKMRQHWADAPLGIYSASIGIKQLDVITFAGIQSIVNKAEKLGHIDLCIIDECFVGETLISTPSGDKRIDQVRCGDVVYNQSGRGVVNAVSCKISDDIYIVRLSNGKEIKCTGNHPFFTEKGWVKCAKLEKGSNLFSIKDMRSLWERVQTLDKKESGWVGKISDARTDMDKAKILLAQVCKEIKPDSIGCSSKEKNQSNIKRNKAQTYKTWRERAIASLATVSLATRTRGGLGCRASDSDKNGSSQWDLSERLQSRHSESGNQISDRVRWRESWDIGTPSSRSKENRVLGSVRVESVTHIKRGSPTPVFNLQVSGHPSYFAEGVAVHNCHLVSHKDEGNYRKLIEYLKAINPHLRVVGLTATPFRLGHGMITDKPAIFDDLIEPVRIEELIAKGYLTTLRSKVTTLDFDLSAVKKRGGEYIESDLQKAVNVRDKNIKVVQEIISLAGDRKAWLLFCTGVDHARNIAQILKAHNITAECVTGDTPKPERERILNDFKAGKITAVTNANVLTTGFDHPGIDLIAMLRPTMSPTLYVQMAGRGMRVAEGKTDCLVLDFAGVVRTHGAIVNVQPPKKGGSGNGEAPIKVCEQCHEILHISAKQCPCCGFVFPPPKEKKLKLHDDDIMGLSGAEMLISGWQWRKHVSRTSGKEMLSVSYYGALSDPSVTEYFAVTHDGYAGQKALQSLSEIATKAKIVPGGLVVPTLEDMAQNMNAATPPKLIKYKRDGKFFRVMRREW